ncbi:chitinase [Streptomyces olivoverticillatus]|uniref:Chitinase n=1 Tax=Streptomyces olivoverticillatus TaxID=66427 RepID=A0A7W7LRR8_9ACTN|nr:chitinase [Streptomyces olivoverticillatus]
MLPRSRTPWLRRRTAALAAAGAALAGLVTGTLSTAVSHAEDQSACRPDGLYITPGVEVPYCSVYDSAGREKMGDGHQRRVIGYFTGWRTGKDGTPAYLVPDIPWEKVTHLNYAFAHVGPDDKISVGADGPDNPATGMTWPGVPGAEMDPALPYQGHFNLLGKFKKQHPDVKTLISVGGWAETGGYLDEHGKRVDSGGFYKTATNADGSVNQSGIDTFADSAVAFVKKYGFNGVDIDYEYPTSMKDAGNPKDWTLANARRGGLDQGYAALLKTLREKLDRAGAADGRHYLLSVAAPSSGYLLRGMETYRATKYLDYVNVMSYDLHGAWNEFVGPNAALYDDGKDAELAKWGVYTTPQYGGIGYLNGDWAYHYFRGALPPGRINLGLPYYTRGWKNVTGGSNGLWGTAKTTTCPAGSGLTSCGDGAVGIDDLWHDNDDDGKESPAGSNPMWHAKNLEKGIVGDYATRYGFPAGTRLTGSYVRNYDATLTAPWLWNAEKKVFLSTEDEQSVKAKAQYVIDKGLGGTMVWELAGDYGWNAAKGQHEPGSTLTSAMYDAFKAAPAYGARRATTDLPSEALAVDASLVNFPLGDSNYPINPKIHLANNTKTTLPGGAEFQFDYGSSAPGNAKDQSGWGLKVIRSDHNAPDNIGGLKGDYNRVSVKLPASQPLAPGASADLDYVYYLPAATPSNWTVSFGGKTYALAGDLARGTTVVDPGGSTPTPTGSPTATPTGGTCTAAPWDKAAAYNGGVTVSWKAHTWKAKWWTQGEEPGTTGEWGVWQDMGSC